MKTSPSTNCFYDWSIAIGFPVTNQDYTTILKQVRYPEKPTFFSNSSSKVNYPYNHNFCLHFSIPGLCPSPFSLTTFRCTIAALLQNIPNNFQYFHCFVSSAIVASIIFDANEQYKLCSTNQTSLPHHMLLHNKYYNNQRQWHVDILVPSDTLSVSIPIQFLQDVFMHTHTIYEEGRFCLSLVYH